MGVNQDENLPLGPDSSAWQKWLRNDKISHVSFSYVSCSSE